jgi:hypothetical protein
LDDSDGITIIDAFAVPRYNYDTQRRVFHQSTKAGAYIRPLFSST